MRFQKLTFRQYKDRWSFYIYKHVVAVMAREVHADGCSGVPDWYKRGCDEHDVAYRTGKDPLGHWITRREADKRLRWYIQLNSIFGVCSPMAWWRWAGVRLLGASAWKGKVEK